MSSCLSAARNPRDVGVNKACVPTFPPIPAARNNTVNVLAQT